VIRHSKKGKSAVKVERLGGSEGDVSEVVEIPREQLYRVGDTGMMRLLPRVRCDYIPIEHFRTELKEDVILFASQYKCYHEMVERVVKVRTCQIPSDQTQECGRPRERYEKVQKDDMTKALRVWMGAGDFAEEDQVSDESGEEVSDESGDEESDGYDIDLRVERDESDSESDSEQEHSSLNMSQTSGKRQQLSGGTGRIETRASKRQCSGK
jgi:hypothetical protein